MPITPKVVFIERDDPLGKDHEQPLTDYLDSTYNFVLLTENEAENYDYSDVHLVILGAFLDMDEDHYYLPNLNSLVSQNEHFGFIAFDRNAVWWEFGEPKDGIGLMGTGKHREEFHGDWRIVQDGVGHPLLEGYALGEEEPFDAHNTARESWSLRAWSWSSDFWEDIENPEEKRFALAEGHLYDDWDFTHKWDSAPWFYARPYLPENPRPYMFWGCMWFDDITELGFDLFKDAVEYMIAPPAYPIPIDGVFADLYGVNVTLKAKSNFDYNEMYFKYRKVGEEVWQETSKVSVVQGEQLEAEITVDVEAEYEYYPTIDDPHKEPEPKTFISSNPSETLPASNVRGTFATLNGRSTVDDSEGYFEYREAGEEVWNSTETISPLSSNEEYSSVITGLAPRRIYEYRAVVNGVPDGETTNFTTMAGDMRATLLGEITELPEGYNAEEVGFVYDQNLWFLDPGNTPPEDTSWNFYVNDEGDFTEGEFALEIVGLEFGATYHFRAYAKNPRGYSYSEVYSFVVLAGAGGSENEIIIEIEGSGSRFIATIEVEVASDNEHEITWGYE